MNTQKAFWKFFQSELSRLPVWPPGRDIAIGDICTIDKRGLTVQSSLAKLGIEVETRPGAAQVGYYVQSKNAFSSTGEVSADAGSVLSKLADAGAELKTNFSGEGSFVLIADSVHSVEVVNPREIEQEILRRDWDVNFWNRRWIYVTEVVTSEPCVLLVSNSKDASASVTAKADVAAVGASSGPAGKLKLDVKSSPGMEQSFRSAERIPFMWRGRCRTLWTGNFGDRDGAPASPETRKPEFLGEGAFSTSWLDEEVAELSGEILGAKPTT